MKATLFRIKFKINNVKYSAINKHVLSHFFSKVPKKSERLKKQIWFKWNDDTTDQCVVTKQLTNQTIL